ncbi:hypothetical protein H8B06_06045 [Sphingobacterium sp. DN00404]|uniref:Uncharacterized protein n=1 Tax=Sphingobacterium micropteri TaxID=2763501 RepID=A0ABR7YM88_9SPHI|nr:hypothetical protein [Sphingobacterium micropteri]MBD1432379.1 hypothetical protein [Sphingobacterium micropteri]
MCLNIEIKDIGNYIRIEPLQRLYYESESDWDKNWISTQITVAAGAFSGTYTADLTTFDFKNFKHDLNNLYDNLNGSLEFRDLEGYLKLIIKGDGIGHFNLQATCCDKPGPDSAELRFELSFDQTFIRPMVNSLKEITEKFPVIGDY